MILKRTDYVKLYISGPITGIENYEKNFLVAERALRLRGYIVVNPCKIRHRGTTWEDYMKKDIAALLDCDGVAILPNWTNSRGANLEIRIAQALGMPVKRFTRWINEAH